MTAPPRLTDPAGRPFPLDRQLAAGGEGTVYTLPADPDRVAKVYHRSPTPETIAKLTAMTGLANPQLLALAAWPTGLVLDARTRQVAGFVMPRLSDCQPIQQLYNPTQRVRAFPRAGWAFQVRAAVNLAAAFDEVHKAGCLVGDVNESNAMVSPQALVRLIDCDSFQVRANGKQYLCEVGKEYYTPPELQGVAFRGLTRTQNHDRFGLAVLIYQLLFVGRHPYMGAYAGPDMPFAQLIKEFRFAQGPLAHTWKMAPPPHTPTFADIPPAVGSLFRRAFERGSEADARPTPRDWHATLKQLEPEIATCGTDPGHTYWRGASSCVWCRLAEKGPEYYFGVAGGGGTFVIDEVAIQNAVRRLEAARVGNFGYARAEYAPRTPAVARPLSAAITDAARAWRIAKDKAEQVVRDRMAVEAREKQAADRDQARAVEELEADFRLAEEKFVAKYDAECEVADAERRGHRTLAGVLGLAAAFGIVLLPFGVHHRGFALSGGVIFLVFGVWLGIHLVTVPVTAARHRVVTLRNNRDRARRRVEELVREVEADTRAAYARAEQVTDEVRRHQDRVAGDVEREYKALAAGEISARRRAFRDAKTVLETLEHNRNQLSANYFQRHAAAADAARAAVAACRDLGAEYQRAVGRLAAGAEAAGRARHLRLHSILDADIPGIGSGRKQKLADFGLTTAADLDRAEILRIPGFGEGLAGNLMAWRREVERQFRFDPTAALSPADQLAVVKPFRDRQKQLLNDLARTLADLEALTPACRDAVERLAPALRDAVAAYEQAEADLAIIEKPAS